MSRSSLTLALLLLATCFAGCGQSGPLYLPGNPSQVTPTPPGPAADSAGESDSERDENGESDDE